MKKEPPFLKWWLTSRGIYIYIYIYRIYSNLFFSAPFLAGDLFRGVFCLFFFFGGGLWRWWWAGRPTNVSSLKVPFRP